MIRESLQFALDDPASALPTMRRYAQEFDDEVLMKHVDLYVNDWTVDLAETGSNALAKLNEKAKSAGILSAEYRGVEVWSAD